MFEVLIDTNPLPILFLGVLTVVFLIQLFWQWFFYWRVARYKPAKSTGKPLPVTVVICAHNEYAALKENLPLILEQEYPDYEVLVVNHASEDDTRYLLGYLTEKYPHLKTITVQEDLNFFSGKKFPLSIGIKSAGKEYILLTDATCRPSSRHWIHTMQSAFSAKTEIVLGYAAFQKRNGFLNSLIRYDAVSNAVRYLSFALAGVPYMGVGRNLSYRKKLFYNSNGFIAHYRITHGDDDLFVNKVANRLNTSIMIEPDGFTCSAPPESLHGWLNQKRTNATTIRFYKFKHRILLAISPVSYLVFTGLFVAMLILNWSPVIVLGLFVLRLVSQLIVLSKCFAKLKEPEFTFLIPVFELVIFLMNGYVMATSYFRRRV